MAKIRLILPVATCALFILSCGSKEEAEQAAAEAPTPSELIDKAKVVHGTEIKSVELANPLNPEWITKGKATYEMKCLACHRLDETRLVGPGWAGVTKKREPVWIMNMITNVDMMLETDEEAQKLLELCLVRMPNQNITEPEAREVLEFMRHNDGEK
jgi:cytochrome c